MRRKHHYKKITKVFATSAIAAIPVGAIATVSQVELAEQISFRNVGADRLFSNDEIVDVLKFCSNLYSSNEDTTSIRI
jgi:hypothetical protein